MEPDGLHEPVALGCSVEGGVAEVEPVLLRVALGWAVPVPPTCWAPALDAEGEADCAAERVEHAQGVGQVEELRVAEGEEVWEREGAAERVPEAQALDRGVPVVLSEKLPVAASETVVEAKALGEGVGVRDWEALEEGEREVLRVTERVPVVEEEAERLGVADGDCVAEGQGQPVGDLERVRECVGEGQGVPVDDTERGDRECVAEGQGVPVDDTERVRECVAEGQGVPVDNTERDRDCVAEGQGVPVDDTERVSVVVAVGQGLGDTETDSEDVVLAVEDCAQTWTPASRRKGESLGAADGRKQRSRRKRAI